MKEKLLDILEKLEDIEYGWVDRYGVVHKKAGKDYFLANYRLQTIDETLKYKVGTCWEQVELTRYYLAKENIPVKTYIVIYNDETKIARHTIAVVNNGEKYYWLESSWKQNNKLKEFASAEEILKTLAKMFPRMYKIYDFDRSKIEVYEYAKPEEHLTYEGFSKYCRGQRKVEI